MERAQYLCVKYAGDQREYVVVEAVDHFEAIGIGSEFFGHNATMVTSRVGGRSCPLITRSVRVVKDLPLDP